MLAIVNGLCVFGEEFVKANVLIEEGKIVDVTKRDVKAEEIIDARNCVVIPGFMNAHTHSAMTLLRCLAEDMPLMEWLNKVWKVEKSMSEKDVYYGAKLAIAEMIKSGTTCFSDQYFHMNGVAKAVEETGIRAVLGYGMIDMEDPEKMEREIKEAKKFIENWKNKNERINISVDPHAPYTCSEELLKWSVEVAKSLELTVHIHVAETEREVKTVKEKTGKTPVEYLNEIGLFDCRTVAAHCVWLSDKDMKILRDKGVSVAHCPISNAKLGSGIARVKDMVELGINVCIGTDGAASNNSLNMLEEMKFSALMQRVNFGTFKAIDVFKSATENGYRAYGIKGGMLKKGNLADVVVLEKGVSYSPMYNPVYSIVYSSYGFEVRDVVVNGKVLMRERELTTIDEEKLIEKVEKIASRFRQ